MSAAARCGEIDADAIRDAMYRPRRQDISPGLQARLGAEREQIHAEMELVAQLAAPRNPFDAENGTLTYQFPTTSPAAPSDGMDCASPQRHALVAGAETKAPGAGIPPPRPVPTDEHFSYIQFLRNATPADRFPDRPDPRPI